jgi:hypothetical protein
MRAPLAPSWVFRRTRKPSQFVGSAQSQITVTNNGLMPMVVMMEALSFESDENGRQVFRPLDKTISVDFSETSFR